MHQALLREHQRKENMRALSLRLLANRIKLGPTASNSETKEMLAAIKIELAWCRRTENVVSQVLPIREREPEFLTVAEGIDHQKIVPPLAPPRGTSGDSETETDISAQLHRPPTQSEPRRAAQGTKQGSDSADRTSVQALQRDVRQLLSSMVDMQQAQQSMQEQLCAMASPPDGLEPASIGKQRF